MGANASASLACGSDVVVPREVPTFKVVLVGDADVGKTSIFLRYTKNQFDYSYQPTMAVNIGNIVKKVNIPLETVVCISLWDLPGREEMDLRRSYYTDIDAAVVVVDISDHSSMDMAGTWRQDILNNVFLSEDSELISSSRNQTKIQNSIPILLVGNKIDKVENSDMSKEEVSERVKLLEDVAEHQGFVGCVSVSAKENDGGVHAAMQSLLRYLLKKKCGDSIPKSKEERKNAFNSKIAQSYAKTLGTVEDHTFVPLEKINIKEFDNLFEKANANVKAIETATLSFLVSMRNFKRSCCVAGLTDSYKGSTEECITGLREQIKNEHSEDGLQAHEDNGFIKLVLNSIGSTTEPIKKAIHQFNSEVNPTCKDVLLQCPVAKVVLEDTYAKTSELHASAVELGTAQGLSERYCRDAMLRIKSNGDRIKETIKLADETMRIVDEEYRKIKTAMMW